MPIMSSGTDTERDNQPPTSGPRERQPRAPLWLFALTVAAFATGTDDMVIAGLLPRLSADLDVTEPVAGQLVTGYALVFALGAPVLAVLTASTPKRPLLIASTVLFASSNLAMAWAPNYPVLLVLRMVAAALAAVIVPSALTIVAALAPARRRGRWLSTVTAGITLSLIAGVPLGTWIAGALDWRATMVFVAALSALAVAGMTRLPVVVAAERTSLRQRLAPLRNPTVLSVSVAMVIAGSGGMMGYIYLAPLFGHLSRSPSLLAALIAVYGLAGFAGVLLGGRGADTLGAGRTLLIGFGASSAMLAVLALLAALVAPGSVGFGVLAAVTVVWAAGLWSFSPTMQHWLLSRAAGMEAAVLALNTSGMYLGFALAGALGGLVLARWGAPAIPIAATVLLVLGGLVLAASMTATGRGERSVHADR